MESSGGKTRVKRRVKKGRVSQQLHTELTEYASLLRAIRVSGMDDLAGELMRVGENRKRKRVEDEGEDIIAGRVRKQSRRAPASSTIPAASGSEIPGNAESRSRNERKPRRSQSEGYTLWPLFPEHCPTPEFELEEEIVAIAEEWFRTQNRASASSVHQNESNSTQTSRMGSGPTDEPITILPTSQIQPLLLSAFTFLSTLLSKLSRHRLPTSYVEKGRAAPMRWVDVLEVAASMDRDKHHGLDYTTIERIQTELCEVYGAEESIAPQSFQMLSKTKQALREMDQKYQNTLFQSLSIPSRIRKRIKAADRARRKEEEDEEDEEGEWQQSLVEDNADIKNEDQEESGSEDDEPDEIGSEQDEEPGDEDEEADTDGDEKT